MHIELHLESEFIRSQLYLIVSAQLIFKYLVNLFIVHIQFCKLFVDLIFGFGTQS